MYESDPDLIWFNGEIVDWADARVHVTSEVATRGTNVFEGVRAYWQPGAERSAIVHLSRHLARLRQSARLIRLPEGPAAALVDRMWDGTVDLVRALGQARDLYLRPTLYIERGRYGWRAEDVVLGGYIAAYPTGDRPEEPLSCIVSSWRRTPDLAISPLIKVGAAYQAFRLPRIEAAEAGCDEAILLNGADTVAETGGGAVFIVRDGVAITPPLADGVLDSITRKVAIDLLQERLGVPVEQRSISRTELYIADEAFLCGTLDEIRSIGVIDGMAIGKPPGSITTALRSLYLDLCTGRANVDDADLLTMVERSVELPG